MRECGHIFVENSKIWVCDSSPDHEHVHSVYHKESGTSNIQVIEWNDARQGPPREYGSVFPVDYSKGSVDRDIAMRTAIADARSHLSAGTVFEIRCKPYPVGPIQTSYGRKKNLSVNWQNEHWGVAWYHTPIVEGFPKMLQEPLFQNDVDEGTLVELGAYVLLARIKND